MASPRKITAHLTGLGVTVPIDWPADRLPVPEHFDDIEVTRDGYKLLWECSTRKGYAERSNEAWSQAWDRLGLPSDFGARNIWGLRIFISISLLKREALAAEWLCALVDGTESWASLENQSPDLAKHPELLEWKRSIEARRTKSGKQKKPSNRGRPRACSNNARAELILSAIGDYDFAKKRGKPITQVESMQRAINRWPKLAPADKAAKFQLLDPENLKKEFKRMRQRIARWGRPRSI